MRAIAARKKRRKEKKMWIGVFEEKMTSRGEGYRSWGRECRQS